MQCFFHLKKKKKLKLNSKSVNSKVATSCILLGCSV